MNSATGAELRALSLRLRAFEEAHRLALALYLEHADEDPHIRQAAAFRLEQAEDLHDAAIWMERLADIERLTEPRAGSISRRQLRAILAGANT